VRLLLFGTASRPFQNKGISRNLQSLEACSSSSRWIADWFRLIAFDLLAEDQGGSGLAGKRNKLRSVGRLGWPTAPASAPYFISSWEDWIDPTKRGDLTARLSLLLS